MNVLVANVGSSSVKLRVVADDDTVVRSTELDAPEADAEIEAFVSQVDDYGAIGHRVVHGGPHFTQATVLDDAVLAQIDAVSELAPLHNPPAIRVIRLLLPRSGRPNVACFDTAFHATIADHAYTYAVPAHWRDDLGVRRYGFHGLSHAWAAKRAAAMLGADDLRVVTCHLGAGASLAAVRGGRCIDTTMGFTPVEGLVMAKRSGDVDPGALAWLVERGHVTPHELDELLNHQSGLRALSGTDDMREVLARESAGDPAASLAVRVYLHRLSKAIAAMAATLEGVDAIVFTGGVGERSPAIRSRAASPLAFLGLAVDAARNEAATGDGDADISADGAAARVLVVHAREDVEIAHQVRTLLAPEPA